jgi:hypothetical protein
MLLAKWRLDIIVKLFVFLFSSLASGVAFADVNHLAAFVGAAESANAMGQNGSAAFRAFLRVYSSQREVRGSTALVRRGSAMSGETHTLKN